MERLKRSVVFDNGQTLKLAKEDAALARFNVLVNSNVALDKESLNGLVALAQTYFASAPKNIRSAEARIAVMLGGVKSGLSVYTALGAVRAQPTDALRYAAAVRDFEGTKLPSDVKYANLSWAERCSLMAYLNKFDFDTLCEAMGNNRRAWVRFFRHFHVFQQSDFSARFTKVVGAAYVSIGSNLDSIPVGPVSRFIEKSGKFFDVTKTGNLAYRTFASRIQTSVDNKDFEALKAEIVHKPGYLFRNLATLSHVCTRKTESNFVELVRSLIDKPKTEVLLSLVQINPDAQYRLIDSKGNTTVTEADYAPVIGEIQHLAERELYRRHGLDGRIEVSPSLCDKVVPFLATNAELDRGSRVPFGNTPYLYFLIHWIQNKRRTDLDHSLACFDANWNSRIVYFGNDANDYIAQSGDLVNAPEPHGATEYSRIALGSVPSKIKYIVPYINVFTGDVFSENQEAYAGFMFSDDPEFSIQRDHVRYDLSQPAMSNVPFIIDMEVRELIIADFNNRMARGNTVWSNIDELKMLIAALKTKKTLSIQRFAELLSGDSHEVSLKITNKGRGKNAIAVNNLSQLVS
jgi:hypothetical protein